MEGITVTVRVPVGVVPGGDAMVPADCHGRIGGSGWWASLSG